MSAEKEDFKPPVEWKTSIDWISAIYYLVLHTAAPYGLYLIITSRVCLATGLWGNISYLKI